MNIKQNFFLINLLASFGAGFSCFVYFSMRFGVWQGLYLCLLLWSCYILTIPAGHGQLLLGLPWRLVSTKPLHSEPFLWGAALLFNIINVNLYSHIYSHSMGTYIFLQLVKTANPYWLIFIVSASGTFYNALFGLPYFGEKSFFHKVSRSFLIFVGLTTFVYLAHQELIICINVLAQ